MFYALAGTGHMSAPAANMAAWVVIVLVIACLAWGVLRLLGLR